MEAWVVVVVKSVGAKLKIQVLVLPLATSEVGLPVGCENYDLLPSVAQSDNLFASIDMLEEPAKKTLRGLSFAPSCIISDNGISWTTKTEASIRRFERRQESGKGAYGIVVNSFEELEPKYVEAFIKVKDKKVWCIGPVSLCNKIFQDIAERGNKAAVDGNDCLKWLDTRETRFIIDVLKIGVKIGVDVPVSYGKNDTGEVMVKREIITTAVQCLMNNEEEGIARRKRAKELGEMAKRAMEEGCSSHFNMSWMIHDLTQELGKNTRNFPKDHRNLISWADTASDLTILSKMGRILAQRGATVTIITSHVNANRFKSVIDRPVEAKLKIQVLELELPLTKVGLPEGHKNFDLLPSADQALKMYSAMKLLEKPSEKVLSVLCPPPSCIISDGGFPWTSDVAMRLNIPRLIFYGPGCFTFLCIHIGKGDSKETTEMFDRLLEAEKTSSGIVVNSFIKLEPKYVEAFARAKDKKVWCIRPVSLSNKSFEDLSERGNQLATNKLDCLKWLDSREKGFVVYVCLRSLWYGSTEQAIELGLGLESSNKPFIWFIRQTSDEFERWLLEEGYEERIKDRGLLESSFNDQVGDSTTFETSSSSPTILLASNSSGMKALLQHLIDFLHRKFDMTDLGRLHLLERAHMVNCNPFRTQVDTESKLGLDGVSVQDPTLYQSLVGGLQYLTFTRLDLSYAVQQICLYMHDPREPHLAALKRLPQCWNMVVDSTNPGPLPTDGKFRLLMTTSVENNSVFRSFFEKQKLTGPNFIDWYRQLRLVLSIEDKENYLEHHIPVAPVAPPGHQVPPAALAAHTAWVKWQKEVVVLVLLTMDLEIQRNLAHLGAYDMLQELKAMYSKQAEQELLQTVREFHTRKQEEGQSVSSHVLKMKGYIENLERLYQPVGQNLAVSFILVSLNKDFDSFVQNYNMHSIGKTVNELHAMLKLHEETLPKKDANPALHAIRAGRVQKNQKNKSHKAGKGSHGKGKARWAMLRTMPHLLLNLRLLHHLRKITLQRTPFATNVVKLGIGEGTVSFSKNNLVYFKAVPRDGIYEIDMSVLIQTIVLLQDNSELPVKKEDVKTAVERLMNNDEEGEERRKRVKEFKIMAKRSMEEGGSSHHNLTMMIKTISQEVDIKTKPI
nr:zinc finger, CCHC-type [Tanacetum cinerariifolium]